jgi:hypothetical protein
VERIFLLSPASCGGKRARILLRPQANFALARALRSSEGAPLGEVFSFLSGLYYAIIDADNLDEAIASASGFLGTSTLATIEVRPIVVFDGVAAAPEDGTTCQG